jgi:tetratricopeptide (TPR) repeat protein
MTEDKARPEALSPKSIRQAFKDWHSLEALGNHPLSKLEIVKARYRLGQYQTTAIGRGLALRETLLTTLDSLRPGDGPADPQEREWRSYVVLKEQYVQGRSPDWVAAQLHVSRGTYYSDQQRALEMVADLLYEQEQQYNRQEDLVYVQIGGHAQKIRRHHHVAAPPIGMYTRPHVPFLTPPRPAHDLVGRDDLLCELTQQLINEEDRALVALKGLPGVGKTSVAVELAHIPEILSYFEGGILWASLGREPDLPALLGMWAMAVGVPIETIANRPTVAERAELVHAAIGLRHMLLIIDNAWQAGAALALKVGGPNCAHLLTTRLTNVALDFAGDKVTTVRELDLEQGLKLLAQFSPQAVAEESEQAQMLVKSVGGLPLALVLMGGYLRKQSYGAQSRRLREALAQLQAAPARLQLSQPQSPLEAQSALPSDMPLSLQATIGLTEEVLDPTTRQALLDLSLFPSEPNTFSEEAALAVIAAPASALDRLVDHGLVECSLPDRYTMHQTIIDYASLQGASDEAIKRMAAYFTQYVEANAANPEALNLELNNITAAFEAACQANLKDLVLRLPVALYDSLFDLQGLFELGVQFLQRAYDVVMVNDDPAALTPPTTRCPARHSGVIANDDQAGQALILHKTGDLKHKQGQFNEARSYLEQSIRTAHAAGASQIEADGLLSLGLVCSYLGEPSQAKLFLEQALSLWRELGSQASVGDVLNALGFACEELCDYGQAEVYLEEALQVCCFGGNRRGEGRSHHNLCLLYLPMGQFDRAREHAEQCLSIYHEIGDRRGEGWAIYHLGRLFRQQGDYHRSKASFEQALHILSEISDWMGQGFAIHNLGLVQRELGDDSTAKTYFEQALRIFTSVGCQSGEDQCYSSLGESHRRQGDYITAKSYLERIRPALATEYPRGESRRLANLGLVNLHLGDHPTARTCGQQAVQIAQTIGARPTLAYNLTRLGQILVGMGCLDEAAATYQRATDLRRELGQPHLAAECLAGLAEIRLAQGDLLQAISLLEETLDYLDTDACPNGGGYGLAGADDPNQIHQTCYRVLHANHDPRAEAFLPDA